MKSTKIQRKMVAVLLGVLAMMAAVVGMMPSLLQVSSAAEATGVAVANSITGSVTGKGTAYSVESQALSVTTTLGADAHAGDYVAYTFTNVATTKLNGIKLVNASGEQIGELKVSNERVPEVNKQSSLNTQLQASTQLGTGWLADAKAVFSTDVPQGTSFTFTSNGVNQPVVYAAREYTMNASITSTNGTGSVGTVFTIPAYPVEQKPFIRLNGTMTFTSPAAVETTNQITYVTQKDMTAGDEFTLSLSDKSGLTFLPDALAQTSPTTIQAKDRRAALAASKVNENGAYVVSRVDAQLEVVRSTDTSVTIRVVSGSLPGLFGVNVNLGNNVVDVTRNNLNAAKTTFSVYATSQEAAGEEQPANNPTYKVMNAEIADLSTLDVTEFYDEAGTEIQPSVYSNTNPSRDIAGYHLMRETAASPNAGTRLIYHRMMTRFVDHTKTDIPGADPVVGTDAPQKEIDGYLYVDKETAANGDVLYVYHKLEEREELKEVTRTITYLDATTKDAVHAPEVQKVTLSRTNTWDTVTNTVVKEGAWSEASWPEVKSPSVENYKSASEPSVPEARVMGTTADTTVEVTYEQDTEDVPESKTVTRTIHYVDATSGETVAPDTVQTVALKRTNVRNLVTKAVTEGTWSTAQWDEVVSPKVDNYEDPETASVPEAEATADAEVTVKYPQGTQNIPEEKTVTRTISFVDATDPKTAVADPVSQTAKLTRTNVKNLVTGVLTEGTWSTAKFAALTAPSVENYDAPDMVTVEAMDVTGDTADNTEVTVSYPQGTEEVPEEKTVTRTLTFTDEMGKQIADPLIQTVTLKRVNVRNKVTGVVTEGTWSAAKFPAVAVPEVAGYSAPSITTIPEADATGENADEPVHITYTTVRTQVKTKQAEAQQKNARALARTGADQSGLFTTALALLVAGLAGLTMARRRRAQ